MMKHVLADWDEISLRIQNAHIVLFLDYDGTLTPIVENPDDANLSAPMKDCLTKLLSLTEQTTVLISGRSIKTLKNKVGLDNLIYVGNHGLELAGPKIDHVHPEAVDSKSTMETIQHELHKRFADLADVQIENKRYTLSIHYRKATPSAAAKAHKIFMETITPFVENSDVSIFTGKKVWEVRPKTQWNKGSMVLWIMAREMLRHSRPIMPIYLGDDLTDEDALLILKDKGIGIKITDQADAVSHASWHLRNVSEVLLFLEKLTVFQTQQNSTFGTAHD